MTDVEEVVQRLDRRENAKVVAYREVGVPVFRTNCLVTLQESGSLGAIEEFVLRCLLQSVDTSHDIQRFLGLPYAVIIGQLGSLAYEGAVSQIDSSPPRYGLTKRGRTKLEESVAARLTKEQMPIYIDGITRAVVAANPQELWTNQQLEGLGIAVVPPIPRRAPRSGDIDLVGVNRMIGIVAGLDKPPKRAVRLDALIGRVSLQFRRAVTLAFKTDDRKQISIAFAIDGRSAEDHDIAFARAEADRKSLLYGVILDSDRRRREAQLVAREIRGLLPGQFPSASGRRSRSVLTLRSGNDQVVPEDVEGIRALRVYEHPSLLSRAFVEAKSRILLVSPRIKARVVDANFLSAVIASLERGVQITIAYSLGRGIREEQEDDRKARETLVSIASNFGNFKVIAKNNLRAKVLLVDQSWCAVTTFEWLSFRGDGKLPMREEEGTFIEVPETIEAYFQRIMGRLSQGSETNSHTTKDEN